MKIIDDKGKLFGLINIIDFLVAVLVVLVIAGVAYKIRTPAATGEVKLVEVQVMVPCVRPELIGVISVGDPMVAGNSYTNVKVKSVEIKPALLVNSDSKGKRVMVTDPYLKDVYVTVEGTTTLSSATITLGGQEIRVGKDYYVKSLDYEFKGIIFDVKISDPQ